MRKYLIILLIAILLVPMLQRGNEGVAFAEDVNGVEVTYIINSADTAGFHVTFFSSYDPPGTDTYYYNNADGVAATSGAVDASHIFHSRDIHISIPTLGSTSVTIRAEGKLENSTVWSDLYTKTYTAATTEADPWPILEYIDQFRMGAKEADTGTNIINIAGSFITERKR